jgi:hypothetical protein
LSPRQVIEAPELVAHLAEDLRAGESPERALATSVTLSAQRTFGIPVTRRLRESFQRRTFEIRKLGTMCPPPVPARNLERAVDMLLRYSEHRSSEACLSDASGAI